MKNSIVGPLEDFMPQRCELSAETWPRAHFIKDISLTAHIWWIMYLLALFQFLIIRSPQIFVQVVTEQLLLYVQKF